METGFVRNTKMAFSNDSYPKGRNTWEKNGCGRAQFIEANRLPETGARYGGACYAEAGGKRFGRSTVRSDAKVSTRLQDAKGQDIRLGVDTDGSAWLSEPEVMDAIAGANPRTVTVYSSGYHVPPPPHPLAERTMVNVTVSGWHPLPETIRRLRWAEETRRAGWNVILREVVANPEQFPNEVGRYNRIHDALMKTDFFVMQQPLHRGTKHSAPLADMPACCQSAKTIHTCDACEVSEGTGKGFSRFYGIVDERSDLLFPALGAWGPGQAGRR